MTHTSIYFVETGARDQRTLLCRWVERFYDEGKKVQVATDSTMAAQHVDQMLWTFSDRSFIPHRTHGAKDSESFIEPVVITMGETRLEGFDVLICDGPVELELMKHYPVVVHFILVDDEERKQSSRLLWQRAREHGFQLHHVARSSAPGSPGREG